MAGFLCIGATAAIIFVAVLLLRGFDRVAGRGPKQVSDGIARARDAADAGRVPCPHCAELIMPRAKICRYCKLPVSHR